MKINHIVLIVVLGGCTLLAGLVSNHAVPSSKPIASNPSPLPTWPAVVESNGLFIRCASYDLPSHVSSPIYRVNDAGKHGVPKLPIDDAKIVENIKKSVGNASDNLRFVEYDGQDGSFNKKRMTYIFLANADDICFSKDLPILNDSPLTTYEPAEDRSTAHPDNGSLEPFDWPVIARPLIVHMGKYGLSCKADENPHPIGPPSYSAVDVGKAGVPALRPSELKALRRAERQNKAAALRFTIMPAGHFDDEDKAGRFFIYRSSSELLCASSYQFEIINSSLSATYYPRRLPSNIYTSQSSQ